MKQNFFQTFQTFQIGFAKFILIFCTICFSTSAANRERWSEGHGDLIIGYSEKWDWRIGHDDLPDEVIIVLDQNSQNSIPQNPDFAFLGEAENPIWIIPQLHQEGVVLLGFDSTNIPKGTFEGDEFDLQLSSLSGPGAFIIWETDQTGKIEVKMNSQDGIDDKMTIPSLGHLHQNLAFTAPGTYEIGFTAMGTLSETASLITSQEAFYQFAVNVFDRGEVELELEYEEGELEIILLDEAEREFETTDLALHLSPSTWQRLPDDSRLSFLGESGDEIFILPQHEKEGVPFLGIASDEIEMGIFEDDQVKMKLVNVEGDGDFFLYETDPFGVPSVFFNSRNGIDEDDVFEFEIGGHSHMNWAFTRPGIYRIGLKVSGSLSSGNLIESKDHSLLFEVFPPTIITEGEVDLEVIFEDEWDLVAVHENGEDCPSDLIFQGAEAGIVPDDSRLSFLGESGDEIFILPQHEKEGVPFLGIASDEIEMGIFEDDQVKMKLVNVEGEGDFFLYETDPFGVPSVFFNSRNGIDEDDVFEFEIGGHSHMNWAFTRSGTYEVSLQFSANLNESEDIIISDVFDLTLDIITYQSDLQIIRKDDHTLMLHFHSKSEVSYQVQSSESLYVEWMNYGNMIEGTGDIIEVSIPVESAHRFYRIVESHPAK